MLKSSLCNYSNAFILLKRNVTINGAEKEVDADARRAADKNRGKK